MSKGCCGLGDRVVESLPQGVNREILEFKLDLTTAIPLIDGWVEDDGADGARGECLAFLGQVPGDGLDQDITLSEAKLEMVLLVADDPGLSHDLEVAREQEGLEVADP